MSPRIVITCLLAAAAPAAGFAPSSSSASLVAPARSALHMASTAHASEDMYPQLLNSASLCAHSDTCSIESAESYLREIVHIQSGCAAGTLSGDAVCYDVLGVSEVVADLREKIGEGAKQEVKTFWDKRQEELENLAVASVAADGSPTAALTAPLKPAYLAIAALYTFAFIAMMQPGTMEANANGAVPFTAQEVWWAVRDGYIGDLAHHMFTNGGLAVSDATTAAAGAGHGLSPQELFWSIRDGYASDTLFASGAEGGVDSVPFTPQEVWWAVKNGYSYDMVEHWFRTGGLSV